MLQRLILPALFLFEVIGNPVTAQDCSYQVEPSQFKARLAWLSGQDGPSAVAAPMVANMNPQVDSMPEIMVVEGATFNVNNDKLLFFRGDGSNANNPMVLTVPGGFDFYPAPGPTIGDINGDGIPELLITCADLRIRVFTNYTENPTAPMTLWITSADLTDYIDQRPYLADFDGDGTPEVYAGSDVYEFDFSNPAAPSLKKVINGPVNQGRAQYANYSQGSCNPTAVDILTVADCNGDPDCDGLELVAGPMIYSIDLDPTDGDGYQIKVQRNLNLMNVPPAANYRDGYTSVADLDLDGTLDIVVTSLRQTNQFGMYVWNKNGLIRFFSYPTNPANSGSLACIANVYDDTKQGYAQDFPEILICSSLNFTCYNLQAAQSFPANPYWWNLPTSDASGWTGSTVYDFNGDGISEIVYRDENNLRILYGGGMPFPTGVDAERNWFKVPCFSTTSDEYPVVADVDNDGETEIAVTGRLNASAFVLKGRLRVYESDSAPWVPCRNVWNQSNYFIVNVNDDLSIPAQQDFHHLELPAPGSGNRPLNTYLSQRPLLNGNFLPYIPLPDASTLSSQVICSSDSVVFQIEICNYGDKSLPAGTPVAFYQSDPTTTSAILLGTVQSTHSLIKKDSCKTFNFTLPKISGTMYGVVNDDASKPRPFQLAVDFPVNDEPECNFLNNIFQFDIPVSSPSVNLGPDLGLCTDTSFQLNAGAGFADYLWQDGSTGPTFQVQQAGVFWVETTDFCAQKQRDSIRLELFDHPTIQLDTLNGDCFGNPAIVTALAQSTYQPMLYAWSSGDTSQSVSGLPDGTYTVTVTNAKGCSETRSTWVEAGGNLQVSGFVAAPILCFGDHGALNLSFQAGNPPFNFLWSEGSSTQDLSNVPAGNYAVTITDADQCSDTVLISILQPNALISSGFEIAPSCPGLSSGSVLFLGAAQGTAPYQLLWSNNATTDTLSGLPSGNYQLTITDANGCTIEQDLQLPEYVAPVTEIQQDNVSCFGLMDGSISVNILSGSAGFDFLWSNNASTSQIWDLTPGTYALTLTYADGNCTQTFDFQVQEPLPILLSATPGPVLCHGAQSGQIDLTVQNGVWPLTYSWSNNANSEDLANLGAGMYQVTVTDFSGCTEVMAVPLTEPTALLSAGISMEPACPGEANGSASFLGASQGTPPYSLLWSTNANSPGLSGLTAGSYQLTLSDANGCSLVESVQVGEYEAPLTEIMQADVSCLGHNNGRILVNVLSGSPAFGYAWSNQETGPKIENLGPGNYALTLTYADGTCAQTFDFQITEPPALLLTDIVVTPVACFGENSGAIDLSVLGGVAAYSYQWTGNQTTEDLSMLLAGDYALTLTDENQCTLEAQFTVPQPEALAVEWTIRADSCQTSSGSIDLDPSGGIQPYQYAWSNAVAAPNQTNLPAGVYQLTLTDANACTELLTVDIPKHGEIPVLSSFTDTLTCVQTAVLMGVMVNQNNVQFVWSAPNGSLPNAPQHTVQIPGDYQVTVTNAFGCLSVAQIQVLEDVTYPVAEAGPPVLDLLCDETMALLNAQGSSQGSGFLNHWTRVENGMVVFDTASVLLPIFERGWYVHSVVNLANGCAAEDSILVNWNDPIAADLVVDPILCFGDGDGRIEIQTVTGGAAPFYYSLDNQPFSAQNTFSFLLPGTYVLRIRDNFGCNWEHSVVLTEPEAISVQLTANDTSLVLGQTLQLNALPTPTGLNLAAIDWEPEALMFAPMSLQQRLKPETRTEFVVRITDQNGCMAEDRLWVSVYNHHIYVPNIILPGSDENSWFTIFAGDGVLEVRSLRIFDRWGEQLFERLNFLPNAPILGWDGSFRGQPMNPGVFVWYAEVLLQDGQVVFLKGDVTVAR